MIPVNRHRLWQLAADAALVAGAWFLAFQLRFDNGVPWYYERLFERTILLVVAIKLFVFVLFGFYDRWWRYVSIRDMWAAARGVTIASLVADATVYFVSPVNGIRLPRSIAVVDWLILLALVAGTRLLARTVIERPTPGGLVARGKEVLVVGAGEAGQLIVKEMQRGRLGYTPIGFVDDDPKKQGTRMQGIRVLGTTANLRHILRDNKPDEVLIAMPGAGGDVRRQIVATTREEGVPVKTLPGLHELIAQSDLALQIRPIEIEDVLGRKPVEVDIRAVASYIRNETVLVTGAGGSIGSELCRQIAHLGPQRLVLAEHGEGALFEIERELVDDHHFSAAVPVLADCGNAKKVRALFDRYKPGIVFHAAAYKHVPLLEANPIESVRNNVLATRIVADAAVEFGAKRFVMISTDKAVNPKTIMGQSKALCEWIVEAHGAREDVKTRFVAVRFGNVLGSSGSVIPIFRKQIAKGGPVRVTHADMTRYFMTVPEAASLVIQAGAIGGEGHVYVLDMGDPVKIVELAKQMIRLSGHEPDRDIAIEIVGVRPGEKLHEELWGDGETVEPTSHPKILRVSGAVVDDAWLEEELSELETLVERGETLEVVSKLAAIVRAPKFAGVSEPTVSLEDTLSPHVGS